MIRYKMTKLYEFFFNNQQRDMFQIKMRLDVLYNYWASEDNWTLCLFPEDISSDQFFCHIFFIFLILLPLFYSCLVEIGFVAHRHAYVCINVVCAYVYCGAYVCT